MPTITTKDETQIYYKDWGTGSQLFSVTGGRLARMHGKTNDLSC